MIHKKREKMLNKKTVKMMLIGIGKSLVKNQTQVTVSKIIMTSLFRRRYQTIKAKKVMLEALKTFFCLFRLIQYIRKATINTHQWKKKDENAIRFYKKTTKTKY